MRIPFFRPMACRYKVLGTRCAGEARMKLVVSRYSEASLFAPTIFRRDMSTLADLETISKRCEGMCPVEPKAAYSDEHKSPSRVSIRSFVRLVQK